jgi:hypothetical protein
MKKARVVMLSALLLCTFVSQAQQSVDSATSESSPPVGGSGTTDFLPLWTNGTTLGSSVLFQSGKGAKAKVGIGTTKPASTLDVKGGGTIRGLFSLPTTGTATKTTGFNSQPMDLATSVFNSSASEPVTQTFQWQAEPVGNDTGTATGSLNLLFGQGSTKPSETGLNIASNGQITFATGQTFPGTGDGTVTSVGSGAGLTGGPITSSGTLSIATGGVTNAMLANSSLTVTAGTDLTGGGSVGLGGSITLNLNTGLVPQLLTRNTFESLNQFAAGDATAVGVFNNSANAALDITNDAAPSSTNFTETQFNATKATFWTTTAGDTNAIGSKSAVVPLRSGEMVKVFSMESPEVWFEDFGSGRLAGGAAAISLDSKFIQTVNLSSGYHVFLTPEGDCKGLFVTSKTNHGFEVLELSGGKSSVEFEYRIVAHRNGYEAERMPAAILPVAAKLNRSGAVIGKKK